MIHHIKVLLSAIIICCSLFSRAQNTDIKPEPVNNDPIVEMLDSLVTINNVIRYNNLMNSLSAAGESSAVVPVFTDEIYRERIGNIITPIPLVYNEQVKNYIDLYAVKRRGLTSRVMGLSRLYFPLFEEILDSEDLPLEFKYLSIVESALNPVAVSRMGATGIWQFMLNTGKMYDLTINSYIDDRRDPIKSTYAACKYFKDMYHIYKDWLLVIAAYNCGAGNVNRAIVRSGGKFDFWEISKYLPKETRGYVPAFIAVCYVMNFAAEHNLSPIAPAFSYFEVDTLKIHQKISLDKIAQSIDIPSDVLRYLNPVYKKGIVPQSMQPQVLRLPSNKISAFMSNETSLYTPSALEPPSIASYNESTRESGYEYVYKKVKKTHVVKRGETLGKIANRYHAAVADLKKLNGLRTSALRTGQKLKVHTTVRVKQAVMPAQIEMANNAADSAQNAADTASNQSVIAIKELTDNEPAKLKYVYHLIQKGDTLWNISKQYEGATVAEIMKLNDISDTKSLKAGTRIKIKISG